MILASQAGIGDLPAAMGHQSAAASSTLHSEKRDASWRASTSGSPRIIPAIPQMA